MHLTRQVADVAKQGVQIALVMGGGNILRGGQFKAANASIQESTAHYMGMLATVMNSLALSDALETFGLDVRVQTAINMQEIVVRELVVRGSFLYTPVEFEKGVRLLNDGLIDAEPLISHTAPMAEGATYFEKMAKDPGDWIKVILRNEE